VEIGTTTNLLDELFPNWERSGDIIREYELLEILGGELLSSGNGRGGASARYGSNEIIYSRSDVPILRAVFSDEHRLNGLFAMEGLNEQDLQLIRDKVRLEELDTVGSLVGRETCFNDEYRVEGWWKYRDCFQILPVPPHAPRHQLGGGDLPFLFEFQYDRPRNHRLHHDRRLRAIWRMHLVLNALLTSPIIRWPRGDTLSGARVWVNTALSGVNLHSIVGFPKWNIDYLPQCYWYEGFQDAAEDFSCVEGMPGIPVIPAHEYYDGFRRSFSPFVLPDDLEHSLDLCLDPIGERRDRILRSAFWINEMDQATSASLRMICAVQAVDALLGEVPRGQRTARFGQFLNQFAFSPTVSDEERRALFEIRSGLSHGLRDPLIMDRPDYCHLHPMGHGDRRLGGGAPSTARVAFYNWLHNRPANDG